MSLFAQHQTEIWSFVSAVALLALQRLFRMKARLHYAVGHSWNMLVDEPLVGADGVKLTDKQIVRTASITVTNSGLLPARNLEVTFNWRPPIYNVWPARIFATEVGEMNRFALRFDSLAPNEAVNVEIMAVNQELPLVTVVRSDDRVAKLISMSPQRVWPRWVLILVAIDMLLGLAAAIYLLASILDLQALLERLGA